MTDRPPNNTYGISRRECLQGIGRGTFAISGLAATETLLATDLKPKSVVVDTHLHCFSGANNKCFPYLRAHLFAQTRRRRRSTC